MNNIVKQKSNIDIFDIAKFILSFFIVAIHTELFPSVLYPWLRIAVPLFFIISSYLFFSKLNKTDTTNHNGILKKFVKRNLVLYGIWFIILLPFTVYVRKEWFEEGIFKGLLYSVRGLIFGSTFRASWYIMALVISVSIIYFLSKKISNIVILILSSLVYVVCCLTSNYYNLVEMSSLSFLCSASDKVFGGMSTSFCSALFWIVIGKIFVEKNCVCLKRKALALCTVAGCISLFAEYKILEIFVKPTVNDTYFSLMFVCPCIFSLLLLLKNKKIQGASWARKSSTITYMMHCEIAMCVSFVLGRFHISNSLLLFASTSVICVIISYCIIKLSETNKFAFLKKLM